jgi:hypothetical protein
VAGRSGGFLAWRETLLWLSDSADLLMDLWDMLLTTRRSTTCRVHILLTSGVEYRYKL